MPIDLSIIIVSYNTSEFLKKCLLSIRNCQTEVKLEVIVVDNASSDRTAEMVKKEFSEVLFIQNSENLGFSKANNIGVKKSHGKYILFLNPDTEIRTNTLKTIVDFLEKHQKAGAATAKVELPSGKLDDACHRGFPTPWNAFCHLSGLSRIFPRSRLFSGYSLGWMDLSTIHEIDACAGAFMMVRLKAGEEIKWWDEDFFWYGEDLDFCFRLKKNGWKVYFVPTVSVLHYKGVSGGIKKVSRDISTASIETKRVATKARFEAMMIFYNKHYKNKYSPFLTWFVLQAIQIKRRFSLLKS